MHSKKSKLLILFIIVSSALILSIAYIFKPPATIENSSVSFNGEAVDFINKIESNSSTNYVAKVIQLNGTITQLEEKGIQLNNKVFCQFSSTLPRKITKGSKITIKGKYIGFDELLDEIKLNNCTIIK
ncbi:hypothetical protein [Flammeovirga kamogawensis]|uniref:tRNA_anti-like n=1 Tax=Flammeovirga kamogawensis TaxID=373891 RepID=A0ABX8H214_9BACT|nr:hypothetical protein [Flammeovirga kamogawensis]MBB6462595.1 hypothetical protein [Flammeovirga kamogawensis]QWG09659.1 hypothetical protein KM029_23945 [Flammeovirga kamogawensis]TRX65173.1 hypothetical protein EO216_21845 [Flammeovirga kamogawensis]